MTDHPPPYRLRAVLLATALLAGVGFSPTAPAAAADGNGNGNGPVVLLDAEGALQHARLSSRLARDVASVWEGGQIGPDRAAAWTQEALGSADYSLALIDSSRAVPRAGSTGRVAAAMAAVEESLWWREPGETARRLRALAFELAVLDGGGAPAGPSGEAPAPQVVRGWQPVEQPRKQQVWRPLEDDASTGTRWEPID